MNINISSNQGEAIAYFVFNNNEIFYNSNPDDNIKEQLYYVVNNEEFQKEKFDISYINDYKNEKKTIFVGLGNKKDISPELFRKTICRLVKFCDNKSIKSISIKLCDYDDNTGDYVRALAESAIMSSYKYVDFLSNKKLNNLTTIDIDIDKNEDVLNALKEGVSLGISVNEARDLVNEPSNVQTPEKLSEEVKELGNKYGFEVDVLGQDDILNLNMHSFYEVAKGSINKPKLIIMRYFANHDSKEMLGLVGKGITFDSGGLNLKKGSRFITMKHDMAGAATVIGAMCSVARQNLKVNVVAVVAACENLISSSSYKPGDIINSMAGKTILINSTDAEGRLTLIDALYYAIDKENVTKVVDIATLTGSARKMFGYFAAPVVSNNDDFYNMLNNSLKQSGEIMCRLPLLEDALDFLKCDIADYVNTSLDETCGMITTSLFLREFVQETPWIHIDGAGPMWIDKEYQYYSKGGTGWGCRTLYFLVKELQKNK